MQSSSLPDLFAYGTGLADFQEYGMPPDDKNHGSANKQEEFTGAAEAAQQDLGLSCLIFVRRWERASR